MEETLHEQFLRKLEEKYGKKDLLTSRFGSSSFGYISEQLSISASQFSKLMAGTATEGMYQRSIKNVDRLLTNDRLQKRLTATNSDLNEVKNQLSSLSRKAIINRFLLFLFIATTLSLAGVLVWGVGHLSSGFFEEKEESAHPLSAFFDRKLTTSFNSPYVSFEEVQDFCPGSAYEGIWSLAKPYKLPIPGRRPGLYYIAKSADVRMKCSRTDTLNLGKGQVLWGYEYLVNEIWLDTKMTPLSPTYFDKQSKKFTASFDTLDIEHSPQFQKVATIHSFFIDQFQLIRDSIYRYGEPCGRFVSDMDEALVDEYEIDINYLLENVLADMTTTRCEGALNPYCDPNDLKEQESTINFACLYTINNENLGFGGGYPYQKGYRLEKQHYSDNLICDCNP